MDSPAGVVGAAAPISSRPPPVSLADVVISQRRGKQIFILLAPDGADHVANFTFIPSPSSLCRLTRSLRVISRLFFHQHADGVATHQPLAWKNASKHKTRADAPPTGHQPPTTNNQQRTTNNEPRLDLRPVSDYTVPYG